jgi:hypothetical protein
MPRPSIVPSHATNANYAGGPEVGTPTKVAPDATIMGDGYRPGDEPGAQTFNYQINLLCQWIAWLAAGTLDGNWEFTGNVQVDGTLIVGGALTFAGLLTAAEIDATSYKGPAGGIASFPSGLTSAGAIKFTTPVTRHIPMLDSCDSFGGNPCSTHSRSGAQWILAASSNAIYFPIDLRDDEQLTAYTVSVQKNDTNNPVSVSIVSFNGATGAEVPQSAGASTPITPGNWLAGESGLTLGSGTNYYVKIVPGGSITPAADRITHVSFSYNRP